MTNNNELFENELPKKNTSFIYSVKADGDSGAKSPILHPFSDNYNETHTYMGVIDNVYGKDKNNENITNVGPYRCVYFTITRPDIDDVLTNYYYAIIDSKLCFYYQDNTKGSKQFFLSPNEMPIITLPIKESYSFESTNWTKFYLNLTETGISLAPRYESAKLESDQCKLSLNIEAKTNLTLNDKSYECYPINIKLITKTGSFMTKATTTIDIKRWYAPEIKYYIKEEYNVFMDALIKSKGTVKKDLVDIIN